ncbi:MAG: ABC transporter ATP-binding protein [Alphaproteobacteria bacterium]|nr:MAG: ABC transporter ATP-binding protein [Alphaproteobacteria bacterium]
MIPLSDPVLHVDGLTKSFGPVAAVGGISFDARRGETVGLLGGNGAGKTTTLSMLLGLVRPTSGTIRILGAQMPRERHLALPHMNFESPYVDLPKRLTVRQNLEVYGRLYGVRQVRKRAEEIAEELELSDLLNRPAGMLSAGQKTRVGLAKALINRPQLLLLDEPTASLDPDTADWVRHYFEDYRKQHNATILLASHNMSEVERLCDNVLMMRQGLIVDRGAPGALIEKYGRASMEEVFLDVARGTGRWGELQEERGPEVQEQIAGEGLPL